MAGTAADKSPITVPAPWSQFEQASSASPFKLGRMRRPEPGTQFSELLNNVHDRPHVASRAHQQRQFVGGSRVIRDLES